MKNQYKNIKKLLEYDFVVEVKDLENNNYCLYSKMDIDGDAVGTEWSKEAEDCHEDIHSYFTPRKEINNIDLEIKAVPRIYKVIPDGSKVDIIDCKELRGIFGGLYLQWSDKAIEMIGQKGLEVSEFNDTDEGQSYEIYDREHTALYTFPAWAVAPHIEEEEETVEIDGDKYIKKEVEKAIKKLKKVE